MTDRDTWSDGTTGLRRPLWLEADGSATGRLKSLASAGALRAGEAERERPWTRAHLVGRLLPYVADGPHPGPRLLSSGAVVALDPALAPLLAALAAGLHRAGPGAPLAPGHLRAIADLAQDGLAATDPFEPGQDRERWAGLSLGASTRSAARALSRRYDLTPITCALLAHPGRTLAWWTWKVAPDIGAQKAMIAQVRSDLPTVIAAGGHLDAPAPTAGSTRQALAEAPTALAAALQARRMRQAMTHLTS